MEESAERTYMTNEGVGCCGMTSSMHDVVIALWESQQLILNTWDLDSVFNMLYVNKHISLGYSSIYHGGTHEDSPTPEDLQAVKSWQGKEAHESL